MISSPGHFAPMGALALLGVMFGGLAAVMAFIITFSEYQKHRLGQARVWREALLAAALAFAIFAAAPLALGFFIKGS
jgi:hypothetical protein